MIFANAPMEATVALPLIIFFYVVVVFFGIGVCGGPIASRK